MEAIPSPPFSVVSGGGSFTLAPRGRRTVRLGFRPAAAGDVTGELVITSDDPDNIARSVGLHGTGR